MTDYAKRMEQEAQKLLAERDNARQDARQAQVQRAEASGKLAAYVEQHKSMLEASDKRPTTRPTNVIERIVSALTQE